ncbi:MAG TPA: helix-turn-helix domain-containing protein [Actinomycetota bacterium]|jgi:DNA-binding HxlR family transcriptional regulator|nr:helix-turn-helix domain-containing protein [Actinomycetota bacterium]
MAEETQAGSPLAEAVARVGDRWTLLIVEALLSGPRRFNDLQDDVDGIAANILSARLRKLEADGLVLARPYSRRPLRVAYELTAPGRDLAGALTLLAHWGSSRTEAEAPRHDACGTPMEARWYCPTCARTVEEALPEADVRYV